MSEALRDLWRDWFARWERFQECYVPDREEQFDIMLDYVDCSRDARPPTHLVDLCAGPGAIALRARRRFVDAVVTAVDLDPWLLELGRRCVGDPGIRWVSADLRSPGWSAAIGRPVDAVLTATAMHWFDPADLGRIYRELATMLRPGAVLVNADVVPAREGGAADDRAGIERLFRWQIAKTRATGGEDWVSFWRAARDEPAFHVLLAEREQVVGQRPPRVFLPMAGHVELLTAAGFTSVTEIWRRDAAAIVAAVRR